jgi:hypothetical protein
VPLEAPDDVRERGRRVVAIAPSRSMRPLHLSSTFAADWWVYVVRELDRESLGAHPTTVPGLRLHAATAWRAGCDTSILGRHGHHRRREFPCRPDRQTPRLPGPDPRLVRRSGGPLR